MNSIRSLTRRLRYAYPLLFLGLAPVIFGCGDNRTQDTADSGTTPAAHASMGGDPVTGDWVVIHGLSDPQTMNYITANDASAQEIHQYMYESLTTLDPATLERIPWIADSLPMSTPDRMAYEFTIRKDVKYSDGEPVTAEDFIFYLKTIKNPYITNAAPIRSYFSRVDSAELIDGDPYRLRVVMAEPYYLGDQWAGSLAAFPKHIWDKENLNDKISFKELNEDDPNDNPAIREYADYVQDVKKGFETEYMIASGPYVFHEYRQNDRVVLRRDPNYWNRDHKLGAAYPDQLVWLTINDYNAALSALKSGDIDFMPRMEKIQFKYEKSRFEKNGLVGDEYDYPAYSYIGYNEENPIFADSKVRNALARALNRKLIVEKIYFGNAQAVQSPIYNKRPEYDTSLPVIEMDLDEARRLLEEAGWKDSDGDGVRDKVIDGKKTNLAFKIQLNSGNQARKQMALIFIDALNRIGVNASTVSFEWAIFLDRMDKREYDAYIGGWAMNPTEGDMYQIWHSDQATSGGSNYVGFKNDRVDELIEKIRGEFDYQKRKVMYQEIQRIIYDEQPYNFLISETYTGAHQERFQGVQFIAPRPCYNAGWWWVPKNEQRYSSPVSNKVAMK